MESEVLGPTQNSKNGETVKNPKTVELVRSDYQPTKAEQKEEFRMDASLERIADAVLSPLTSGGLISRGTGGGVLVEDLSRFNGEPRDRKSKGGSGVVHIIPIF